MPARNKGKSAAQPVSAQPSCGASETKEAQTTRSAKVAALNNRRE
jgi:hypothetical protein